MPVAIWSEETGDLGLAQAILPAQVSKSVD